MAVDAIQYDGQLREFRTGFFPERNVKVKQSELVFRKLLPGDDVRVFDPHPGGQHPTVGAAEGDHRTVLGARSRRLDVRDQLGEVGQRLLRCQVPEVSRTLSTT